VYGVIRGIQFGFYPALSLCSQITTLLSLLRQSAFVGSPVFTKVYNFIFMLNCLSFLFCHLDISEPNLHLLILWGFKQLKQESRMRLKDTFSLRIRVTVQLFSQHLKIRGRSSNPCSTKQTVVWHLAVCFEKLEAKFVCYNCYYANH
jgi:hypothetical protein